MVHSSSQFYDGVWTQERDDYLIRHLDFHSCYDQKRYTAASTHIFESILAFKHDFRKVGITPVEIGSRFQKLENRYETWSSIVAKETVRYDGLSNTVYASEETWKTIYEEYELGHLYSNNENEHMWPELCGIFGPDSVRKTRNALITPYPQSKMKWENEIAPDSEEEKESPERWIYFNEETYTEFPKSDEGGKRVPKGHICPYPGEDIMNPPAVFRGNPSSSEANKKVKKGKSKRFLEF